MKTITAILLFVACLASARAQSPASNPVPASPAPPPSAPPQRSAADLQKLAEPIALHPDPLIALILPASAYPVEIVQAARFVRNTNNIAQLESKPWDENVKAVARFPELIAKMDADLDWTTMLGQAFIDQPKDLMDAIQALRSRAQQAGTLQSTPQQIVTVTNTIVQKTVEQQVVVVTNTIVQIQPSNPQVIYVPTYPTTVYYPPPAYVYDPYAPLVTFGAGLAVGIIIANNCDWHGGCVWGGGYHGDVDIDINNINNIGNINNRPGNRPGNRPAQKWQPDQNRLRSSGAPGAAQTREARGWGSGAQAGQRPATGTQPTQNFSRPSAGTQPARAPGAGQPSPTQRPASAGGGARPTSTWQPAGPSRPSQTPSVNRASPSPSVSNPGASRSGAFSGVGSGSSTRSFSNRGASSRSGGFGGGGSRGGGRGGGGRR